MRTKIFQILFLTLLIFMALPGFAQEVKEVEMADAMRSSGKIYVVIAVILTILAGLIAYLVRLDRKISKLERGEHN